MLLILLVVLVILCLGVPFVGPSVYGPNAGPYVGWSPLVLLLVIVLVLYLAGVIHL